MLRWCRLKPNRTSRPPAPHAAVVVLPQRMVVRHAAVRALLRVERGVELPRERVNVLELRARRRRYHLVAQGACGTGDS